MSASGSLTGAWVLTAIFVGCGALSMLASLTDAGWFFRSAGVRMLTGTVKRRTARIIYFLIGAALWALSGYIFWILTVYDTSA